MDIKDLRYFKTIAECGSFSKAAAHLRIAQPALSRKIQKMEHTLGVTLLRRAARGVTPTDAGRVLLARALKFEHDFDDMRHEMARYAERATGVLRVAVQSPLSLVMAPELLRAYRPSHPGVTLELTEGFSGDLVDGLLNENIDIAVVDTPTHPHADLSFTKLWIESLQLVGPVGGLIRTRFGNGPLPLRELMEVPIIMPCQRHAIRVLVDVAFERQHLRFRPAMEANGALMILQIVRSGFGYSLMPANRAYPWVSRGELEAIDLRPTIRRTMSVVTRTALLEDPRVAPLRELVISLAPAVEARTRFGPDVLYMGGPAEPIMPSPHGAMTPGALAGAVTA